MNWYQLTFAKRPPLHWLSHLDLQTVWIYALRRSGLPVAYSEGFNPQPRLSILMPLEVGVASEVEILSLRLTAPLAAATVQAALATQLPGGLAIHACTLLPETRPPLTPARVNALAYRLTVSDLDPAAIAAALAARPAVTRVREGKSRVFALADEVLSARVTAGADGTTVLDFALRARVSGALRAGEYAAAAGATAENIVAFTRQEIRLSDGTGQ